MPGGFGLFGSPSDADEDEGGGGLFSALFGGGGTGAKVGRGLLGGLLGGLGGLGGVSGTGGFAPGSGLALLNQLFGGGADRRSRRRGTGESEDEFDPQMLTDAINNLATGINANGGSPRGGGTGAGFGGARRGL